MNIHLGYVPKHETWVDSDSERERGCEGLNGNTNKHEWEGK